MIARISLPSRWASLGTISLAPARTTEWCNFGSLVSSGLYLGCTILSLTARSRSRLQWGGLCLGSGLLGILAYAQYVNSQFQLPMLIEHGGQMLMPLVLVCALWKGAQHPATKWLTCIAVVMTFAGHGAYAVGFWPTPATFHAMTSLILGVEYETATQFLLVAGTLDFVVCVALFLPWLRRSAALYAAVWGMLTALARPVAGMSTTLIYWGADQYLHETILRAPHFMLPLFLFLAWKKTDPSRGETSATNC